MAAVVHVVIAALLLDTTQPLPQQNVNAVDIALVFEPAAVEDEPRAASIIENTTEFDPAENMAEAEASEENVPDAPPAITSPPTVSARSADEVPAETAVPSATPYALSPGTQSVLRGLQCPGDPDAFARTGICPQGAGQQAQLVAAEETASSFYLIDIDSIRAQFGQAPHSLSGQTTLDNGTQRRALPNADAIREALPASQPDPAFGD